MKNNIWNSCTSDCVIDLENCFLRRTKNILFLDEKVEVQKEFFRSIQAQLNNNDENEEQQTIVGMKLTGNEGVVLHAGMHTEL